MPPPTDYTDLDYASIRARLIALATSAFPDVAWDAEAALETLLLDLNAYVGDVLAKYLNSAGRESRITTATQRANIIALCKIIGYKAPGARASRAVETFTLTTAAAKDVVLPAGTVVKTAEITSPVKYQLLTDLTIPAGQTVATATVENSEAQFDGFASTGRGDQAFVLSKTPYLDGSASIHASDGDYVEVVNFLGSKATDRHFTVAVDQLDRATVVFGNARNGSIPSDTIQIRYKTGGGAVGNVIAGKINRIEGSFVDLDGNTVRIAVTNAAKAEGGAERQTLARIRELAPESIRVISRAVSREDFEIGARQVTGVARALMLTRNEDVSVGENSGALFIVPDDGGAPSVGLVSSVMAQFKQVTGYPTPAYPMLNTFLLNVQGAAHLSVNISAKTWIRKGYDPASVAAEIRSRVADYFALTIKVSRLFDLAPDVAKELGYKAGDTSVVSNPLVDFGFAIQDEDGEPVGSYAYSDVYNLIRDTPGVLKISSDNDGLLLNGGRIDLAIDNFQFPVAGTLSLVNASNGAAI